MADLQISLPDSIREYVVAQVSSGRFNTVDDFLEALVSADEQAQAAIAGLSENPQLAELLEHGLASGEGRRWSATVLSELKQQVWDRAERPGT